MKRCDYRAAILFSMSVVLSGCGSTGVEPSNVAEIAVNNTNPSIVVLGRRHIGHNETEVDYISCIGENVAERAPNLNVIPEQQFINAMYPHFEESTAPLNITQFANMAQEPAIAKKINNLNLQYVVWIDGKTEKVDQSGSVSCAVGPGGGGCFGFAKWDEEADYQANIWDIDSLSLSDNISTERSGTSYLPAIIVPIPLLANVKDTACNDMARRIEQSIVTL